MVFFWALWVDMFITSENRHKTNEVVISRPDASVVVLYCETNGLLDTPVLLVREYRVCAHNAGGAVWELPGGSSFDPTHTPLKVAQDEVEEEAGVALDQSRLQAHGMPRQYMATTSAHRAHAFSARLTAAEWARVLAAVRAGDVHGVGADTERTTMCVHTLRELLAPAPPAHADFSTIGILTAVLAEVTGAV
eukprot:TRINITY_DN2654_c0_g1_i3.p1 TRINITY_DN2654_c0_g1~~TRINITY_DN2654_c0_g1_i3.p1  ORF type:complete len:192 (+),score=53.04 TRINITY_DN2654_c0_g1_i3:700-1275(+)